MLFIAHRGDHTNTLENSLQAFKNAINNPNYVGFELDIRETKDHYFVVNHDAFYNGKRIKGSTYHELKKSHILSLKEVLKLKHHKIIMLEIKDYYLNYDKLISLLDKYHLNIYLMSFYNKHIDNLIDKKYKVGLLNYFLNTANTYQGDFICLLNIVSDNTILKYLEKMEVFLYGLKQIKRHRDDVYLIVDKVF